GGVLVHTSLVTGQETGNAEDGWLIAEAAAPADKPTRDVLQISIDKDARVTVPGRKEPLTHAADVEEYLKERFKAADRARKATGGPESKVKTTVLIKVDESGEFGPVATVLKLCHAVGYPRLELQNIRVPIEPELKLPELAVQAMGGDNGTIGRLLGETN